MSSYKILLVMIFSMLLGNSVVVLAADFWKGWIAYESGDYETAIAEWNPLAEQGDPDAQYNLGVIYNEGYGVPKNYKTAVKWFTKAAEQGSVDAQYSLGTMYARGNGVSKDMGTAITWFYKASEKGHAKAQFNLGQSYWHGNNVVKDKVRGYMWFNMAAANGLEVDISKREKYLSHDQINRGQDMSTSCFSSNYMTCRKFNNISDELEEYHAVRKEKVRIAELKRTLLREALEKKEKEAELQRILQKEVEQQLAIIIEQEREAEREAANNMLISMPAHPYIYDEVLKRWNISSDARNGMYVDVLVQLVPTGEVKSAEIVYREGTELMARSAWNAVLKVGRFDKVSQLNPAVFDMDFRKFIIRFKTEDSRN